MVHQQFNAQLILFLDLRLLLSFCRFRLSYFLCFGLTHRVFNGGGSINVSAKLTRTLPSEKRENCDSQRQLKSGKIPFETGENMGIAMIKEAIQVYAIKAGIFAQRVNFTVMSDSFSAYLTA